MFKPKRKALVLRQLLFAVVLSAFLLAGWLAGQNRSSLDVRRTVPEYEVKAAFLLNFAKFVDWPLAEENRAASSFAICIVGEDPFGSSLDRLVEGETINDRPIVVTRVRKWAEPCRVLFVPGSERDISGILSQVGPAVLTVGESPEFLRDGGMINFVVDERRIRFDVNRGAAERAAVQISSRLLGVARTVSR